MRDVKRYTRHTTHVQADEHPSLRDRSAAVFGNRFFVEVVAAVERLSGPEDGFVTTRRVANDTGISDSVARPVMLRLRNAGLIAELPREGGPRSTLLYQVRRGPLWAAVLAACTSMNNETVRAARR
jgi:hypothetical protein